jgi:hypothetical protein
MMLHLIVLHDFGGLKAGDHISDPALVAEYIETHPTHVVKFTASEVEVGSDDEVANVIHQDEVVQAEDHIFEVEVS